MKLNKVIVLLLLSSFSVNLYAGGWAQILTTTSGTSNEHRAYAGLAWSLNESFSLIPDATLGFRSVRVKSNDNVSGGDISARISLKNGLAFDSVRLSYIGGERDVLGNLGIGYSYSHASLLGTVAVQSSYTRLGADFELTDKKFIPYLEVLTLDSPNKVNNVNRWVCPSNHPTYYGFSYSCY